MYLTLKHIISPILFLTVISFPHQAVACLKQEMRFNDTLNNHLKNSIVYHYKNYPQEKVFAHINQSIYAAGETIWYKLYVTAYGKPTTLSKIAYFQLCDEKGRVITQNKRPLKGGTAYGNIDLPDTLISGWYELRGFTSWMCNFDPSQFFHQLIYIKNVSNKSTVVDKTSSPLKYHVDFYPEGGDLVAGNSCNVAFKATDNAGSPVNITGNVVDRNKQAVTDLATIHNGMGLFKIEPKIGEMYVAAIRFPDKTLQYFNLPIAKTEGIVLRAIAAPSSPDIEFRINYGGSKNRYSNVLLVALQSNGNVITYNLNLALGTNEFSLKKNIFSTGILRLTVFDHMGFPAAERVVFVDNHDNLNLKLDADSALSQTSEKQGYKLSVKNASNIPVIGDFSVAVTQADATVNNAFQDNIASSLLISSELKGEIFEPISYFKNESDSLKNYLDLVMLTNGWRHFKWEEILNNKSIKLNFPIEKEQFIAGKITDYKKPLPGKQLTIKILILNQDSSKYIGYVTPDSNGRFILNNYDHAGISSVYLETSDKKNHIKKLKITLLNSVTDSISNLQPSLIANTVKPNTDLLVSNAVKEKSDNMLSQGIVLETVVVKDKKLTPTEQVIKTHVTPLYTSITEYTLDLVHNPTLNIGLINYIQGRFPGLQIMDNAGVISFSYLSSSTLQTAPTATAPGKLTNKQPPPSTIQPYFFLNESPVLFESVKDISLNDVALIRFIPPPVVFAPYNGGNVGAILIYTKNNIDEQRNFVSDEEFNKYVFSGYSITREFSPGNAAGKMSSPTNNHITLFWSHQLITDEKGHAQFSFIKPDKSKKYIITIQGMDKNGNIGYLNVVRN